MMYTLMIDKAGDAAFAVVFCGILIGSIFLIILYGLIFEWAPEYFKELSERRKRVRRNKNRKGYVYINSDRRYR